MSTAERLEQYYPFEQNVIDEIAEFADYQSGFESYRDFFGAVGIPEVQVVSHDGSNGATVVDVRPKDHDEKDALVMHLPMGNPLNSNQLYQVATIAGTNPDSRVIAFGNPSSGKFRGESFTRSERKNLINGELRPLVENGLRYLEAQGVESANEIGYSYGALKVLASANYAAHSVDNVVSIEPVNPTRSSIKLGLVDFPSTEKALGDYTGPAKEEFASFKNARDDEPGMIAYVSGLARLTNLAIGRALAHTEYGSYAGHSLDNHAMNSLSVVWGSESELADDTVMQEMISDMQTVYDDRVKAMRLEGQKHAMVNDPSLHAAIVKQALSR
ncbi:MAG: hypothetical protein U5L95_04275 [Candidatus Saccharibacteria bacterium]|nr:hypothetical protein [Candidatus Saccharibacteria bacterium]